MKLFDSFESNRRTVKTSRNMNNFSNFSLGGEFLIVYIVIEEDEFLSLSLFFRNIKLKSR